MAVINMPEGGSAMSSIKLKHGVRSYDTGEIKHKTITQTRRGYLPDNSILAWLGT